MAQKTPDPAVEQLLAGLGKDARCHPIYSDLRPTDSRLDTRRSCASTVPNTPHSFFFGVGGRA
jgi:hypothetical protein